MDLQKILDGMTLKDKICQLSQIMICNENFDEVKDMLKEKGVGSLILATSSTAGNAEGDPLSLEQINELQKIVIDTCGVPLIFGHDVIHGHKICFPIPLAMSAAFNPELVEECYSLIGDEAKNDGVNWSFAPMLDVSRDPRWGRVIEGPGEDPYLGEKMAEAVVNGFQGKENKMKIAACAKHYVGYGASEGGRDYHKTEISDYSLRNFYLKAFKSACKNNVATVMNSFNEISGQPTASSRYLLTDVLRGELGFNGFVISDWGAVEQLVPQGVAEDKKMAAELALNAGLDMDMVDNCYLENLEKSVEEGKVSVETINESVLRVLKIKDALGLFENPYFESKKLDMDKHREYAKEMAKESIVMLKNKDNALPLSKDDKLVIMGEMCKDSRSILGSWSLDLDINESVNIYDGIKNYNSNLVYYDYKTPIVSDKKYLSSSDAVIVVIGESDKLTGEANSISNLEITEEHKELIKEAKKTGKKVIGVMLYGRPRAIYDCLDDFDAVLYAWHGGSQSGNAIAEILFGIASPSGRLPISLPRATGQVPIYYNCPPSGRPVNGYYGEDRDYPNYWDVEGTPLFPFGYGLTYSQFEYDKPKADKDKISLSDIENGKSFNITVDVKNIGNYDCKETVQCYIRDCLSSMTRPIKELKGFEKAFINKGESKTITFKIGFEELGFFNGQGKFVVEPGEFKIYVGENAYTKNSITVKVL